MDKPKESQMLCKEIYYSCITKCKNPVKKQKILESKLNTKKLN